MISLFKRPVLFIVAVVFLPACVPLSRWRDALTPPEKAHVMQWLAGHPVYRLAAPADCDQCRHICDSTEYRGYQLATDLNGDGQRDVAVVFVNQSVDSSTNTEKPRFALAIFNGPLDAGRPEPNFFDDGFNLATGGLFHVNRKDQVLHLLVGTCASEGCFLVPGKSGYTIDCGDEDE